MLSRYLGVIRVPIRMCAWVENFRPNRCNILQSFLYPLDICLYTIAKIPWYHIDIFRHFTNNFNNMTRRVPNSKFYFDTLIHLYIRKIDTLATPILTLRCSVCDSRSCTSRGGTGHWNWCSFPTQLCWLPCWRWKHCSTGMSHLVMHVTENLSWCHRPIEKLSWGL